MNKKCKGCTKPVRWFQSEMRTIHESGERQAWHKKCLRESMSYGEWVRLQYWGVTGEKP